MAKPAIAEEVAAKPDAEPDLYEECLAMFAASITMPALTNLRSLARKGKLPDTDAASVLELPLTYSSTFDVMVANKEIMLEEYRHDSAVPFHVQAAEAMQQEYRKENSSLCAVQLMEFDDEHNETELVYGIARNSEKKRIILAFRGSVSLEDYKTDFNIIMEDVSNPLKDEPKQPDTVLVHSGFLHYLMDGRKGEGKFHVILRHLRALLSEHPDHELYITGHSLGGSLATLAAFMLASAEGISKPITLITFGALAVGNIDFRWAFQAMEEKRHIRALRVVTDGDLIPLIYRRGGFGVCRLFKCQSNVYRHVGFELKIYENRPCSLWYPPSAGSGCGACLKDVPNQFMHLILLVDALCCRNDIAKHHSVYRYMDNLTHAANDLEKMSFDDVVEKRHHGT